MESWHRRKCDELDGLLREHFTRQEEKQHRLEVSVRTLRNENAALQQSVAYLTTELDRSRDAFDKLKSASHSAQLREQALAAHQQLLRNTELDLIRRREELDRMQTDVHHRLDTVSARENDMKKSWEQYNEAKATLDAALSAAEKQVQADLHRAQTMREQCHAASCEAQNVIVLERGKLRASEAHMHHTLACTRIIIDEANERLALQRTQLDEQCLLWTHHNEAVNKLLASSVSAHNATARTIIMQQELAALKDQEQSAKLRRERDALRQWVDREADAHEEFHLECQRIVRLLKALTTDLVPYSGHSQKLLDQLSAIQIDLDSLRRVSSRSSVSIE